MELTLWRLHRRAHGPGLDGIGGLFAEGRWHKMGSLVIYFGATPSIVVLERLAHLDPSALPSDLVLSRFSADISVVDLDNGFDIHDFSKAQTHGDTFLRAMKACALRVPSVLVPEEQNVVVNPKHPDAQLIVLVESRDFEFDGRLLW